MKLSEAKKYKKLISALKGTEISNEEVQKTLIAEGIILSNFYQELEMNSNTSSRHARCFYHYCKDRCHLPRIHWKVHHHRNHKSSPYHPSE